MDVTSYLQVSAFDTVLAQLGAGVGEDRGGAREGGKVNSIFQSLIQSDYLSGSNYGNFETVILEGQDLHHWWRDNGHGNAWQRGQIIVSGNAAGPGCIIQSDFRSGPDHGNFEVVVPLPNASGGMDLWHYWHDNSDVTLPWQPGQMIAPNVAGPGCIIQSDFRSGPDHGNFEVVVRVRGSLIHFWHDNSDVTLPWQPGQLISDSASGWASIIQSNLGSGVHGNFEVLLDECSQSVVAYYHQNQDVNLPWLRHVVLPGLGEPYPARRLGAVKLAQLTGEYDKEGWNGQGTPTYAFNRTETNYGIRGCDLGASFPNNQRLYFLFGDTWRVNQRPEDINLDSVAYTESTVAGNGIPLTFLSSPPLVDSGISQRAFEVPLDGTSLGEALYVFFSTDHTSPDGRDLMGRSVVACSDDGGYNYHYLYDFSRGKFINVSLDRGNLNDIQAQTLNLPRETDVLWIWGSGRYRSSDVYLAVLPISGLPDRTGIKYFAGDDKNVRWSDSEPDATALFCSGSVGELSVRWTDPVGRYLAFYNGDNPGGILMHHARNPWGPWSPRPVMAFDPGNPDNPDPCAGAGYGRFMHVSWNVAHCDNVQDDMFGIQRDNEWGGVYGPYQIPSYATPERGGAVRVYFVMSTWNPYQVMLMTATITPGDVGG